MSNIIASSLQGSKYQEMTQPPQPQHNPSDNLDDDVNLFDYIAVITDDTVKVQRYHNPITGELISLEDHARAFLVSIFNKFNKCSEIERRDIARSDSEFYTGMKDAIKRKVRLENKEDLEVFGESIYNEFIANIPPIPRIPRGKELFWIKAGDPLPELTSEQQQLSDFLQIILDKVWKTFGEFYPEIYSKLMKRYGQNGRLNVVLNLDRFDEISKRLFTVYKQSNYNAVKVIDKAISDVITWSIIPLLTQKDCYMNTRKRRQVFNKIHNTIMNKSDDDKK